MMIKEKVERYIFLLSFNKQRKKIFKDFKEDCYASLKKKIITNLICVPQGINNRHVYKSTNI